MATLSLKKAKPIGETSLKELTDKFVVMRQARHESSFRFSCFHDTLFSAKTEAIRLSAKSPSERYLILQVQSWIEGDRS
jgi:hypothetical protein